MSDPRHDESAFHIGIYRVGQSLFELVLEPRTSLGTLEKGKFGTWMEPPPKFRVHHCIIYYICYLMLAMVRHRHTIGIVLGIKESDRKSFCILYICL